MSPTVSPPEDSADASLEERPPPAPSGACGWTTVVVLPLSIAPVPASPATRTATTSPPRTPAKMLDRPFTTAEGRSARLIRRKTRVWRNREQTSQPRERPAAVGGGAPQRAPVAGGGRPRRSGPSVALPAKQPHVARRARPRCDLEPPLELR